MDLLGPLKGHRRRNVWDCGFLQSRTDPPALAPPPNVLVPETEFSQQLRGVGGPAFSPFLRKKTEAQSVSVSWPRSHS